MSYILRTRASLPGQQISNGDLFYYDSSRSKTLSVSRQTVVFGRKGNTDNAYLEFSDGNTTGAPMIQNGTITKIASIASSGNTTKSFELYLNGVLSHSFSFPGTLSYENSTVNVDFNQGDEMRILVTSTGSGITDPKIILETAWRV